jgi:branched-chain amino acid transport system substrate-binding protein
MPRVRHAPARPHRSDAPALTRRRWLQGAAAALGALALPARAAPADVRLGAVLELSGAASIWGRPQRESLQLVVDEVNARGGLGGRRLDLVVYDNESNETKSLVLAKRLAEQDGVVAVIGAGTTPTTMPMIPYVTQAGVPLVSMGSADVIVTPAAQRRWVFKTASNASDIAAKMLQYLAAKRLTPVAFLSVNNAYGDAGQRQFEKQAGAAGIAVTTWEKFGANDKDMKPQLTKARASGPKAIVVWAIPPAAALVARNAAELSLPRELQMVHDHGAGSSPAFLQLTGPAAEGTVLVTAKLPVAAQLPAADPQRPLLDAYAKAYRARTREEASAIGGMAYDAMLLVRHALETGGPDRARLRDALERTRGFVGVTGVFSMSPEDHNGLGVKDLEVARVEGGKLVRIAL